MKPGHLRLPLSVLGLLTLTSHAAELTASDREADDRFGGSVSISGSAAIVGADWDDYNGSYPGSAYLFRNLDAATGSITQNAKLTASDGAVGDGFAYSVSLSSSTAIVGAWADDSARGSAYLFRNLNTSTGSITQNAKLTASDGATNDDFGRSVSLSGSAAIVGARWDDDKGTDSGSAYLFRNLDTASGSITQDAKLTASDGARGDYFGRSVSLSGSSAIIGAWGDDDKGPSSGSAYLFRNLDTASGSITQNVKLTASDGAAGDGFGYSLSLSGSAAIVGAYWDDDKGTDSGSAYLFRNLDTASGSITQNAKLTASDGAASDYFGYSLSISGNTAIVGAYGDDDNGSYSGSAYLFLNLDTATGSITQDVKLTASDSAASDLFGASVSLDGDNFIVGAHYKDSARGKAYTGSISSFTTLNEGNASRTISGISFNSSTSWIIGETTDNNTVTLTAGDIATVIGSGKSVHIGQTSGSDDNALIIAGTLNAIQVHIGSHTGNFGNTLLIQSTADISGVTNLILVTGNFLEIEGDLTNIDTLLAYLGGTGLQAWNGDALQTVDSLNHAALITATYTSGYTTITPIPEPSALLLTFLAAAIPLRRRI